MAKFEVWVYEDHCLVKDVSEDGRESVARSAEDLLGLLNFNVPASTEPRKKKRGRGPGKKKTPPAGEAATT